MATEWTEGLDTPHLLAMMGRDLLAIIESSIFPMGMNTPDKTLEWVIARLVRSDELVISFVTQCAGNGFSEGWLSNDHPGGGSKNGDWYGEVVQ